MSRDYKNIKKSKSNPQGKNSGNFFAFSVGIIIGVFITSVFIFNQNKKIYSKKSELAIESNSEQKDKTNEIATPQIEFEFPTILEKREVEKIAEKNYDQLEADVSESEVYEIYILQVGSFKNQKSADTLKATLAFSGLSSYIQKKDILGKGISYRVLIGPFEDVKELEKAKKILSSNNVNSITFKQTIESKSM
jgi:cell division protein FtsN|tara:strand:- start:8630 stop:9208 length:579 start_codon:yes stop_codon:yes gene_type:complete